MQFPGNDPSADAQIRFNGQRQLRRPHSVDLLVPLLSRRAPKPAHSGLRRRQDLLVIRLRRSANDATDYFQIPRRRVVEEERRSRLRG